MNLVLKGLGIFVVGVAVGAAASAIVFKLKFDKAVEAEVAEQQEILRRLTTKLQKKRLERDEAAEEAKLAIEGKTKEDEAKRLEGETAEFKRLADNLVDGAIDTEDARLKYAEMTRRLQKLEQPEHKDPRDIELKTKDGRHFRTDDEYRRMVRMVRGEPGTRIFPVEEQDFIDNVWGYEYEGLTLDYETMELYDDEGHELAPEDICGDDDIEQYINYTYKMFWIVNTLTEKRYEVEVINCDEGDD